MVFLSSPAPAQECFTPSEGSALIGAAAPEWGNRLKWLDGKTKTLAELESRSGSARIVREEAFFFEKLALIEAVKE